MANIMSMVKMKNQSSRNGFDLSMSRNFSAKVGELLPIWFKTVFPGDVFEIKASNFTRTLPLDSATFGRMREYYDFYFVPYSLLWNKSESVFTQMNNNSQSATSLLWKDHKPFSGELPYISTETITNYLKAVDSSQNPFNYFGFKRSSLSKKILWYLGYPDYTTLDLVKKYDINVFPLLAYQKIYSDWFRYTQWENSEPSTFNLDFVKGTDDCDISALVDSADFRNYYNFFDLRYCNHNKDLFFGVLPSAQFGDEAVVPLSEGFLSMDSVTVTGSSPRASIHGSVNPLTSAPHASGISILALRQAEYLQKWKEIAMSTEQDYKAQVKAHWDIDVPDYYSDKSRYLGGISGDFNVGEVLNNNLSTDTEKANIAGKGTFSANGNLRFDSKGEYGILMCIYHCQPLVDYTLPICEPDLLKCDASSYLIPEMDKIGMQSVPVSWMYLGGLLKNSSGGLVQLPEILGFAPRYVEYKTSIDRTTGELAKTLAHWVLNYSSVDFGNSLSLNANAFPSTGGTSAVGAISYPFFKVNPHVVDELFGFNADSETTTDGLMCSAYFDIKAVRNLDVNGLPY